MKVIFVGQMHYYWALIGHDLKNDFDVELININPDFYEPQRYDILLEKDADVWVFFRGEFVPKETLDKLSGVKVWFSTEPIQRFEVLDCMERGKGKYDYLYHYDKTHIPELEKRGFKVDGELIQPVAIDTYKKLDVKKEWDAGFFGRDTKHRSEFFGIVKRDWEILHACHGIYKERFIDLINRCKVGLNIHIEDYPQLEPRVQQMIACGTFVMSEPLTHHDCFKPDKHYIEFKDKPDFMRQFKYWLENQQEREKIAENGMKFVQENLSARKVWGDLIRRVLNGTC